MFWLFHRCGAPCLIQTYERFHSARIADPLPSASLSLHKSPWLPATPPAEAAPSLRLPWRATALPFPCHSGSVYPIGAAPAAAADSHTRRVILLLGNN